VRSNYGGIAASRDPKSIGAGMHSNEWESSLADRIFLDDSPVPRELEGSSRLQQGKFQKMNKEK
jgi:hypothetical protein